MNIKKIIKFFKTKEQYPVPKLINSNKLLENKVALITGGSSGIGFAIAKDFIENGAKVIIVGRNRDKINQAVKILGNKAKGLVFDITNVKEIPRNLMQAVNLFEEKRIDILVNSAGIGAKNSFLTVTEDEYDAIMDTNIKATFFMNQVVCNYMINNKIHGHILNVSSSSAMRPAWTPYEMSKWSVRGFTLGAADLLAPYGIIVNAIAPGPTVTPMLRMNENDSIYNDSTCIKRSAMPNEIASLATYMCSEMGNMIVGDTFYITGGAGNIKSHI